jgi:DNA end-binding protein Ku
MASSVWKGYISFGLVSVPVRLFAAARESHVSFNQLHSKCGSRIKQQTVCPICDEKVERSELSKGFEVDKDVYVTVTSEELKGLEAASSEVMAIEQFVSLDEVDPLYFQTSYYSVAEEPGRKAYTLLFQSMKKLNLAAIAKVSMHGREQVVIIRPYDKGLVLHTLYYASEVREISEYGHDTDVTMLPQETALAEQFIQQLKLPFNPDQYRDTYREQVMQLIEKKREGLTLVALDAKRKLAPVVDLIDALKKSLAEKKVAAGPELVGSKKPVQRSVAAAAKSRKSG